MGEIVELLSIRDRDLREILQHYGLSESIDEGIAQCFSCADTITWDNIGALLVKGGTLVICCNLSECIDMATKEGK